MPNPESALNEEAGKLLLEQYDDYAKRARLYTSIQAKQGKLHYTKLADERKTKEQHKEDQENTPKNTITTKESLKRPLEQEKKVTKKRMLRRV